MTGPEDLRARLTEHATADLVAELASLRPRPGAVVGYHTRIALRELGRRAEFLDRQLERLEDLIVPLVTGHAPSLIALHGVGSDTAALLHSDSNQATLSRPGARARQLGSHAVPGMARPAGRPHDPASGRTPQLPTISID